MALFLGSRQGDFFMDALKTEFGLVLSSVLGGKRKGSQAKAVGFEHGNLGALVVENFAFKLDSCSQVAHCFYPNLRTQAIDQIAAFGHKLYAKIADAFWRFRGNGTCFYSGLEQQKLPLKEKAGVKIAHVVGIGPQKIFAFGPVALRVKITIADSILNPDVATGFTR